MIHHGEGEGRISHSKGDFEPYQGERFAETEMVLPDVSETVQR